MTCEQIKPLLSAYMDKALDPKESAETMAHVLRCAQCQQELEALTSSWALLQALPAPALPVNFKPAFWAKARGRENAAWLPLLRRVTAVWGLGLGVGAALFYMFPPPSGGTSNLLNPAPAHLEAAYFRHGG